MKYLKILIFCAIFFCKSEDSEENGSILDSIKYFVEFSGNQNQLISMGMRVGEYIDSDITEGIHYNFNKNHSLGVMLSLVAFTPVYLVRKVSLGIYYQYLTSLGLIRLSCGINVLAMRNNDLVISHTGIKYGILVAAFISNNIYFGWKIEHSRGEIFGPRHLNYLQYQETKLGSMTSFGFVLGWLDFFN